MCHGKKGLGDGPAAKALQTSPPALAGRVQELGLESGADLVMQGQGDMPGYAEALGRKDAVRILKWLDGLDPLTGDDR
jgi:mono/diheme cytochrome c family protein